MNIKNSRDVGTLIKRIRLPRQGLRSLRKFGILKNKIRISKDFDALLPEDVLRQFENNAV